MALCEDITRFFPIKKVSGWDADLFQQSLPDKLGGFCHCSETSGTNFNSSLNSVLKNRRFLNVRLPLSFGMAVTVTDIVSKLGAFIANFTFCHGLYFLSLYIKIAFSK